MSAYRVGFLDLVRSTAAEEAENKRRVLWIFGSVLAATHAVDVATAVWLLATDNWQWGLHFKKSVFDIAILATGRALLFPALTASAVRPARSKRHGGHALLEALLEGDARTEVTKARGGWAIAAILILSTGCQVYTGLKVNGFHFKSRPQTAVACLSVLWTNLAAFLAREIIRELTREEALYLPKVHPHGLVYDPGLCRHWCDLCNEPIRSGGAYRCKLCDFDVCLRCAGREDAAEVGENVLRTDSGVKVESRLSSATYLGRALHLARSRSATLFGAGCALCAYSSLSLALPSYQGRIIDHIVQGRRHAFTAAAQSYLILMILQGALRATYSALFSIVSRTILYEVRTRLFASMLRQDVAFFDGSTSGHLSSRLTNDAQTMMAPIDASLSSLVYNSAMLVGGIAMCFYTSYSLAMLAFVVVGPITTLWDAYSQWSKRLTRATLAAWADANSSATEALANVRIVKAFAAEGSEATRYAQACAQGLRLGILDACGLGVTTMLSGYLDLGTGVLILWYGGLIVLEGGQGLSIGKLITFQLYWTMLNTAYNGLQGLVTSFTRAAAAAEKVFSLVDTAPDIDRGRGQAVDWPVQGRLDFCDVSFYYAMRPEKLVLDSVTLRVEAGTTLALVGRSGSGKSTMISLLLRFYDPRRGSLALDGVDVRSLDVHSYRSHFGTVMQDTPLFARSLRHNVAYPSDDATLADVEAAAKRALAYDFVAEMQDAFETRVGERGGRLSGGQRQRVAIARVFLRQPRIVLLDEATSALDEASQAAVQESLDALIHQGGSTVVLVAHRLSTVVNADRIAVVDKGSVVEHGNHRALLAKPDGVYAALYARQLAKAAQSIDEPDAVDALLDDINANDTSS